MRYYCLDGFLKISLKNAWYFGKFCLYLCIDKKVKNMTTQIEILKTKEVLTAEEAKLVFKADLKWADQYLFRNDWNNTYLNLDVYSEVEKEEYDLRREIGF